MKKLNLGAGPTWSREGWDVHDHNVLHPFRLPHQAWNIPCKDEMYDIVFSSHMIEHISHFWIEKTISEINRIMKPGGILRLITPNLEVLCKAYVERDLNTVMAFVREDSQESGKGIRMELGPAQALLGFLYSPGYDNFLLDSSRSKILAGYVHVCCYDFELLSKLLDHYGFTSVERMSIDESRIPEHRSLRNVPHDADRGHSLVVECIKDRFVPFEKRQMLLLNGPYPYENVVEGRYLVVTKCALWMTSRMENFLRWMRKRIRSTGG